MCSTILRIQSRARINKWFNLYFVPLLLGFLGLVFGGIGIAMTIAWYRPFPGTRLKICRHHAPLRDGRPPTPMSSKGKRTNLKPILPRILFVSSPSSFICERKLRPILTRKRYGPGWINDLKIGRLPIKPAFRRKAAAVRRTHPHNRCKRLRPSGNHDRSKAPDRIRSAYNPA